MKAWQVSAWGDFREVLNWVNLPCPQPGPGQCLVRIEAAGVNFADTLAIAGRYQVKAPPPFIPGAELAGTVVSVGSGVSHHRPGDRVVGHIPWGAFAEYAVADAHRLFPVPDAVPAPDAAAMLVTWQTAWFALGPRSHLQPDETLLVHAGTSGVGLAAIQLGKRRGARVIATAGGPDKTARCLEFGADLAVDYRREDFVDAVQRFTDGRGADVIYDPVGGETTDRSLKAIAWNGRLVIIGFASGEIPQLAANRIMLKNIAVVGLHWPPYLEHDPELVARAQAEMFGWQAAGELVLDRQASRPLQELPEVLRDMVERRSVGKNVLEV